MKNYDSQSNAFDDLQIRDYTYYCTLKPVCLEYASLNIEIRPVGCNVDKTYIFQRWNQWSLGRYL